MKRLFTLMVVCCLCFGCLAGCGEKSPALADDPVIPGEESTSVTEDPAIPGEFHDGKSIQSEQLEKNFHLVCNQVGIDPEQIQQIRFIIDTEAGDYYEFAYDDKAWVMRFTEDDTVESIYLGLSLKVFDKNEGAYHINDFEIDDHIKSCVEALTQDNLKAAFGLGSEESLNFVEWYVERETSLYHSFGYLMMKNDADEEEKLYFSMSFENCPDEEMIYLRFFIIENDVLLDEMAKAIIPERVPAVEQTASE